MRRFLCVLVLVLVATTAHAAPPFMPVPIYPTGEQSAGFNPSQAMVCGRFVMPTTIVGATKLAGNVTTGYGVGKKIGMAIYPDGDGLAPVASAGNIAADTAQVVVATGLAAFDLTGGLTYRACWCATGTSGTYAAPNWVSMTGFALLQNAFVASVGKATNTCDATATPPASTGAIVANAAFVPPLLVVSVE